MNVDQLEVLLRTVPQWTLFVGLTSYIFGWIQKKPMLYYIGESIFALAGLMALLTLTSGMIPNLSTPGIDVEISKTIINMLMLLIVTGIVAIASIVVRLWRKKSMKALMITVFALTMFVFFQSTTISKVKFELNVPVQSTNDTTKVVNQ